MEVGYVKELTMEENIDLKEEEKLKTEAGEQERGVIIAPMGRFDQKELAARRIRKIMGL